MALTISSTADCNKIIIIVPNPAQNSTHRVQVTNGENSFGYAINPGTTNTRVVDVNSFAAEPNGIFIINYTVDGVIKSRHAILLSCNIQCCLASKLNAMLDCGCEDPRCSTKLAEAQKIFLMLETAESELATADNEGTIQQVQAVIDSAQKKYVTALNMCAGHCGCNC